MRFRRDAHAVRDPPHATHATLHGAAELVHLAHLRAFESAVVVSNDSDLARAIEIVRKELGKPVGIINPQPRTQVLELHQAGSFTRTIRQADIQATIFPDVVHSPTGPICKPAGW